MPAWNMLKDARTCPCMAAPRRAGLPEARAMSLEMEETLTVPRAFIWGDPGSRRKP
jgi:hypothetical protein